MLARIPRVVEAPPAQAPTETGVISVVIDGHEKRVRALPTLYLGPQPVYANRDTTRVGTRLADWVEAIATSSREAIYTLRACEFDGRKGLYGRELFEGSAFRRKLEPLGFQFDPNPFVSYAEDGCFYSRQFGKLPPDFMILAGEVENPDEVLPTRGAMLPFVTVTYRLGPVSSPELARLVTTLWDVSAVSAARPETLVSALRPT